MKIVIIGPGAMGCLFAGLLTESGHEVWLLDKNPQRAKKLSQTGLHIEGIGGCRIVRLKVTSNPYDITVPACRNVFGGATPSQQFNSICAGVKPPHNSDITAPDLVFVWVKAYDTPYASV